MNPKNSPPLDGGWGWMVVLGAALINMVNQVMFANFGLIFGQRLKELAGGRATGITLVMALMVLVSNFSGLLIGPLMKILHIRTINFIGIFLVGSGMIASSFSTEIWHICLAYSTMTGVGLGLLASGTFLAINNCFTTRKSTAVGLSMAGTSIGQMVTPTFIGMLLKKYQFSGTTFALGFLSYTGVIGAMLFKPILCCKTVDGIENEKNEIKNSSICDRAQNGVNMESNSKSKHTIKDMTAEEVTLLKQRKLSVRRLSSQIIITGIEELYKDQALEICNSQQFKTFPKEETWPARISRSLGFHLLKDLTFVHLLLGLSFSYMTNVTFNSFYALFLQDEKEFTMMETTTCITAMSFSDVMGRMTVSELFRRLRMGNRTTFMVGATFLALGRSCMAEMSGFKFILSVSFFIGYFRSITVINQNLVMSEHVDKDDVASAIGLTMVVKALLTLTLGQVLGLLKDQLGYGICIHILDGILLSVVICWTIELLVTQLREKS